MDKLLGIYLGICLKFADTTETGDEFEALRLEYQKARDAFKVALGRMVYISNTWGRRVAWFVDDNGFLEHRDVMEGA